MVFLRSFMDNRGRGNEGSAGALNLAMMKIFIEHIQALLRLHKICHKEACAYFCLCDYTQF